MTTINMDVVKQRLASLQQNNKKSSLLWKPTHEEQTIRVVPYKYSPGIPFIELYFHYDIAGKSYISPVSFGQPDPIMLVAQKLKSTGDKENWKMGKNLEPKLRTFAPIIVRGKEHEGIKFWGFGKTIYEQLLSNMADESCGDITDPIKGRDIVVWTVKEEGKSFETPKIRIKMTTSRISDDGNIVKKIASEQPDIKEVWELKTYEELEDALKRHLNPESESNDEQKSEQKDSGPQPSSTKEEKGLQPVDDIDEAFRKAFGE